MEIGIENFTMLKRKKEKEEQLKEQNCHIRKMQNTWKEGKVPIPRPISSWHYQAEKKENIWKDSIEEKENLLKWNSVIEI